MNVIKVASHSRPYKVAGAIAGVFREHRRAEIQVIGAGAVNQAVKALIIARSYLLEDGYTPVVIPLFVDIEIHGRVRTAIRFVVLDASDTEAIQHVPLHMELPPEPGTESDGGEEDSSETEENTSSE
ncbi:MAG: stage V sporulation protein S [Chloroflexi bacterium]|nr:stage V sporulation protein S [Chloroflexota bacterium]